MKTNTKTIIFLREGTGSDSPDREIDEPSRLACEVLQKHFSAKSCLRQIGAAYCTSSASAALVTAMTVSSSSVNVLDYKSLNADRFMDFLRNLPENINTVLFVGDRMSLERLSNYLGHDKAGHFDTALNAATFISDHSWSSLEKNTVKPKSEGEMDFAAMKYVFWRAGDRDHIPSVLDVAVTLRGGALATAPA